MSFKNIWSWIMDDTGITSCVKWIGLENGCENHVNPCGLTIDEVVKMEN